MQDWIALLPTSEVANLVRHEGLGNLTSRDHDLPSVVAMSDDYDMATDLAASLGNIAQVNRTRRAIITSDTAKSIYLP